MLTVDSILGFILPVVKLVLMIVFGIGFAGGLGYFLFVVLRRRRWYSDIYEKKADGRLHLVGKDVLYEKKVNRGKQSVFLFKYARSEGFPPSQECVYRVKNKEYCDYIRIADDFIPMKKEISGTTNLPTARKDLITKIHDVKEKIKSMTRKEIEENYIYVPIHKALTVNVKYTPMEYDVNMMRINAIDIREKIYIDKMDFWQKYGNIVAIAMVVVLIIVVLYMSYEYSGNVIQAAMGKAQSVDMGVIGEAAQNIAKPPE